MESTVEARGIVQETTKPVKQFIHPRAFWEALEVRVVGQPDLKLKLAHVFSHYTAFLDNPATGKPLPLIYGPSGAGKTYAIEICCEIADLPMSTIGGAGISPAGYKGTTLRDLVTQHFMEAKTPEGVIFIDEVDKWCKGFLMQYEKPDPEAVALNLSKQAEALRYVERETVSFIDEAKDIDELKGVSFDTGQTFWIFAGAFVGLNRTIARRTGQEQISSEDIWEAAEPPDFIHYGLVEEFTNRISVWAWVKPLTSTEVIAILQSQDVPKWNALFDMIGCKLDLDISALATAATLAIANKRGPRAAKEYLNRVLGTVYTQVGRFPQDEIKVDGMVMTTGRLEVAV